MMREVYQSLVRDVEQQKEITRHITTILSDGRQHPSGELLSVRLDDGSSPASGNVWVVLGDLEKKGLATYDWVERPGDGALVRMWRALG